MKAIILRSVNDYRANSEKKALKIQAYFSVIMSAFYVLIGIGIAFFQFPFRFAMPYNYLAAIAMIGYGFFRAYRLIHPMLNSKSEEEENED